jgi:hypothetical protein
LARTETVPNNGEDGSKNPIRPGRRGSKTPTTVLRVAQNVIAGRREELAPGMERWSKEFAQTRRVGEECGTRTQRGQSG